MHGCPECSILRERIRDLESALDGAVYVEADEARRLTGSLGLTQQQADLVYLLYRAKGRYVRAIDLGEALPRAEKYGLAPQHGDEFRPQHYVTVVVAAVRKRLGKSTIENLHGYGYRLSKDACDRVRDILTTTEHRQ